MFGFELLVDIFVLIFPEPKLLVLRGCLSVICIQT